MSFAIGVPSLTQCETASISWAGPEGVSKTIQGAQVGIARRRGLSVEVGMKLTCRLCCPQPLLKEL